MPWTTENRAAARQRGIEIWAARCAAGLAAPHDPVAIRARVRAEVEANRARIEAILYAPENIWRPRPKAKKAKLRKIVEVRVAALAYPYIRKSHGDHAAMVLAVHNLVPRGLPGREDVCQEIMLAVIEGRIKLSEVNARQFITRFKADNHENYGAAVSLDVPLYDGRMPLDVLSVEDGIGHW